MIADNGRGFDVMRLAAAAGRNFGLQFMRERAELMGAQLHIESRQGEGTRILLRLPSRASMHGKEEDHPRWTCRSRPRRRPRPTSVARAATAARGKTRVVIVDGHTLFRRGVRNILELENDIEVVGEAGSGREALADDRGADARRGPHGPGPAGTERHRDDPAPEARAAAHRRHRAGQSTTTRTSSSTPSRREPRPTSSRTSTRPT